MTVDEVVEAPWSCVPNDFEMDSVASSSSEECFDLDKVWQLNLLKLLLGS